MKKNISLKEIVLLAFLLLLIVFYVVKTNIDKKVDELQSQKSNIDYQIQEIQPRINQMVEWEKELEEINEKYAGNPVSIPEYNNINAVIAEMSVIFDEDSSYSISFSTPRLSDHIVSRTITITFSCYDYEGVCDKLNQINNSRNRYRITNLDIVEGSGNLYSVNMTIIAYEYSTNNAI